MSLAYIRLLNILAGLVMAGGLPAPSLADPSAPTAQSACEIRANEFKAQHPRADSFDYLKFGFFYFGETGAPGPPMTYRDPESAIVFHVKADGRHVAAVDSAGRLLWLRNPFVDSNLCPYRSAHPYISWIGAPGDDFGRIHIGLFKPTPDTIANGQIVEELDNEIARGRKVERPKVSDRFIGLSFNSSQYGFVDIRNGEFYEMGQD